jgi:NADH dehydrogenase
MEQTKPVLVVGATGLLGTEICRQLKEAGKTVKALIRTTSDPAKLKGLQDLGIETVTGDIKDATSLQTAMADVRTVISTASSTLSRQPGDSIDSVDRQGQLNVVEAAKASGVMQFVFISFIEVPESFPLQDAKRAVEERLQQSGMTYTILRPTNFMEVWLGPALGFDATNHTATLYGQGSAKTSWIAVRDVAAFAVAALDNTYAHNRIVDLGGPEALSPIEVVRLFEQQTGTPFQIQYVPEEAIRAQKENAQDPLQQSFAALMLAYAQGCEVPMEETLKYIPVKLTSVNDYCNRVAGTVMMG